MEQREANHNVEDNLLEQDEISEKEAIDQPVDEPILASKNQGSVLDFHDEKQVSFSNHQILEEEKEEKEEKDAEIPSSLGNILNPEKYLDDSDKSNEQPLNLEEADEIDD